MAASVSVCTELMRALAPERDWRPSIASLAEIDVGVAWLGEADPLVAERVREAAEASPRCRPIDVPLVEGIAPVFMREAAETHRELWAEHREAYGANVAAKLERCFAVTDEQYASALRAREMYREEMRSVFAEVDLLVTPTVAFVAPAAGTDDLEIRDAMIRLTYPFNANGGPALALPCGPAEHDLPASLQLAGPPGADALVLAAGALIERELAALR
jgi:Asp-tRNA(Asn)/Glu-tRNA(Gln) amidotransferase A subunit family amidase